MAFLPGAREHALLSTPAPPAGRRPSPGLCTRVRCDRTAQIAPAYGLGQRRVVCAGLDTHRRIG